MCFFFKERHGFGDASGPQALMGKLRHFETLVTRIKQTVTLKLKG